MSAPNRQPLVLLAAGGTGGHLFPAEALALALAKRGVTVALATDRRAAHYQFPAQSVHLIPSATMRGRGPLALAQTFGTLGIGTVKAWLMVGKLNPDAVVGFGGYPTVPPLYAATLRGVPTVLHEQNSVMGRANRFLAPRVSAIATGFADVAKMKPDWRNKATLTGNPVRPAVIAAAGKPFIGPGDAGMVRLVVFGGSQGAQVMSQIVPAAVARFGSAVRARLAVTQQARPEDVESVRATYARLDVIADVAPFFADLPMRIAQAHLVVSRSGASTVAEMAAIGRPAVFVPLPHALDQDQLANAGVLERAGGAIRINQPDFTPERLAAEIGALIETPERLAAMAAASKAVGTVDAAERLADLVLRVART
jgi:UDP-N-acetylglucosamine--N-acetylmuramyl-(pentapeptide) pyrophosphoryl-undecaprenol N-acetylglucosamine transferase